MALKNTRSTLMADQAIAFAEYADEALVVAQQLGLQTRSIKGLGAAAMARKMKERPPRQFTEAATLLHAIAVALNYAEPTDQVKMLAVANKLMNALQATMLAAEGR